MEILLYATLITIFVSSIALFMFLVFQVLLFFKRR